MSNCSLINRQYNGIFQITSTDIFAGFSTVFFFYVINQIMLAKRFNLLPFVHFEAGSLGHVVNEEYWTTNNPKIQLNLSSLSYMNCINNYLDYEIIQGNEQERQQNSVIYEHALWTDYFEPITMYTPSLFKDCPVKLVKFNSFCASHILNAVHCHPESVKAYNYGSHNRKYDKESIFQMRLHASQIVENYIKPLPKYLIQRESFRQQIGANNSLILGIHLRGTDKGDGRKRTDVHDYIPYIASFFNALPPGSGKLFVATDDSRLLSLLHQNNITNVYSHHNVLRSDGDEANFNKFKSKLAVVNEHVYQDILMLSTCDYLLHGDSAVSESVIYLNFNLHYRSVNIDRDDKTSPINFQEQVQKQWELMKFSNS